MNKLPLILKMATAFAMACVFSIANSYAQNDLQTSILLNGQVITISKNAEGKDFLLMNANTWNMLKHDAMLSCENLAINKNLMLSIKLQASRKLNNSCNIDVSEFTKATDLSTSKVVNKQNPLCKIILQKIDADTIQITFFDTVDWASFQP